MRIRSFRLRIAVFSALISGLVLFAFGAAAYGILHRMAHNALDAQARDLALRQMRHGPHKAAFWDLVEEGEAAAPGLAHTDAIYLVQHAWGRVALKSDNWPDDLGLEDLGLLAAPGMALQAGESSLPRPRVRSFTRQAGGKRWRLAAASSSGLVVVAGLAYDALEDRMSALRNAFLIALAPGLLAVVGGAILLSRRALASVRALGEAAGRITAAGLDYRIDPARLDSEFEELVHLFNAMLDRLERSFNQARRFSADAAHELKTPITILRGRVENALGHASPGSDMENDLAELLEEIHRLTSIIEGLLMLSRADAGKLRAEREEVDLAAIVEEAADDARALAPGLEVRCHIETREPVRGDAFLLGLIVRNLATNAVKYNRPEGKVDFRLDRNGATARLQVVNTGDPIATEDRERVFDRFRRLDDARTRQAGGIGLGLSLSREAARAQGGELAMGDAEGDANAFVLTLPDA